jgi:thiamine-monophosphate kinase
MSCADSATVAALRARLDRPLPRVGLGLELAGVARAAIDISDGLLADLGHLLQASGVGAVLDLDALPASIALQALLTDIEQRWPLQLAGGDDYELLITGDAESIEALPAFARGELTRIGRLTAESGLAFQCDGRPIAYQPPARGYEHFATRVAWVFTHRTAHLRLDEVCLRDARWHATPAGQAPAYLRA